MENLLLVLIGLFLLAAAFWICNIFKGLFDAWIKQSQPKQPFNYKI